MTKVWDFSVWLHKSVVLKSGVQGPEGVLEGIPGGFSAKLKIAKFHFFPPLIKLGVGGWGGIIDNMGS